LRIVGVTPSASTGARSRARARDARTPRILRHDPAELVLTARAGTSLAEIEAVLAGKGQRLPFEPPHFGPCATLGGTAACGLAGPARAWSGPLRDSVLAYGAHRRWRVLRFGAR